MITKQIDKFRNDYLSWSLAERDAEKRGEERKAIESAKIMLSDNMPINLIQKYVQLSESEILLLKESLN